MFLDNILCYLVEFYWLGDKKTEERCPFFFHNVSFRTGDTYDIQKNYHILRETKLTSYQILHLSFAIYTFIL